MHVVLGSYLLLNVANLELGWHTTHTAAIFTIKRKWAEKKKNIDNRPKTWTAYGFYFLNKPSEFSQCYWKKSCRNLINELYD